jgi:phage terminase Nu1 subunit (DNA packaging protein)
VIDAYTLGALLEVQPATIRQWAARGLIRRAGRDQRGRTLYDPAEVAACAARRDTPNGQRSTELSQASVTVTPGEAVPAGRA